MIFEIIKLLFHLSAPALRDASEVSERHRQAVCQLKLGRELLWQGRFEAADIRFGVARRLNPMVVSTLSWKEREAFKLVLGDSGQYGDNAHWLWEQLR